MASWSPLGPSGPDTSPEALLTRARPEARPCLLLSGAGEPELSRWSAFVQEPVGITTDPARAEAFVDGLAFAPTPAEPGETLPFVGGALGYVSYDAGWAWAPKPRPVRPHPWGLPEMEWGLYDAVVLHDRWSDQLWLVHQPGSDSVARAERMRRLIDARPRPVVGYARDLKAAVSSSQHRARIRRAKVAIADGEVYQVNLTYPRTGTFEGDPRAAMTRLARRAPPFAAFLTLGPQRAVLSASPECFVAIGREGRARTYPIKGTRPRGATTEQDRGQAAELLASEKDRAEHLMIVDLLRNDLGRIAETGGVSVPRLCYLESFSAVHHLTSCIEARLDPGWRLLPLLRALFPGGSITGAPKLRAMELIDQLEGEARGLYTGSILALSPAGLMASIAIRTAEIIDGAVRVGVGGGIVHDSDPDQEWEETVVKAAAICQALTG